MNERRIEYQAVVRLAPDLPQPKPEGGPLWAVRNREGQLGICVVFVWALNGVDALNRVHRTIQKEIRGQKPPTSKKKPHRYTHKDYTILELVHPGTGPYDLPKTPNPDLHAKPRKQKAVTPDLFSQTEIEQCLK